MCVYLALPPDPRFEPWQTCAITLPAEITAAAVLIGFWDHNVRILLVYLVPPKPCLQPNHVAIYVAVLIIAVYSVNLFGTRYGMVVVPRLTSDMTLHELGFSDIVSITDTCLYSHRWSRSNLAEVVFATLKRKFFFCLALFVWPITLSHARGWIGVFHPIFCHRICRALVLSKIIGGLVLNLGGGPGHTRYVLTSRSL